MARVLPKAYYDGKIIDFDKANLSIGSSAVLYGLSVYTVLPITKNEHGELHAFRVGDHYKRLCDSARIIGIDLPASFNETSFLAAITKLATVNKVDEDVFVRATIHVDELVPGTRSRGMHTVLSIFLYEAVPIIPQDGARLKTSVWRRIPDFSIPSRAKVNGAYINSVLAKQDAIDSGYDDCILLDSHGHVCELSAANIFIIRDGVILTPDIASDLLEGINRRTVIEMAKELGLEIIERSIDLTELYVAEEVFVTGTSAFVSGITEIDARTIGNGQVGPITKRLREAHQILLQNSAAMHSEWLQKV